MYTVSLTAREQLWSARYPEPEPAPACGESFSHSVVILFEKDRLLLKAKHSQKKEDWATAKRARNEANILIRNSKSDFIQNNLELHRNDAKKN